MSSLTNIPSTETGKRMLRSVSPIYDKSYVARCLFEAMGLEMEEARKYVDEFRYQVFPETATWGLVYWEQRYHIKTDERLPIEERRQRVAEKRWKFAPMNPTRLEEYIFRACQMPAHVVECNLEYRFEVIIGSTGNGLDYNKVYQLVKHAKPSHIAVTVIIEANCNIAIQPAVERYLFASRVAGTYPYRNVVGRPIDTSINVEPEGVPYPFESVMAGTRKTGTEPARNMVGRPVDTAINVDTEGVPYMFESIMAGTRKTGTEPVRNMEGSAPAANIVPGVEATAFPFESKLCGAAQRL